MPSYGKKMLYGEKNKINGTSSKMYNSLLILKTLSKAFIFSLRDLNIT